MSRAFTKEPDGDDVFEDLPDRPVGEERNLVTPQGMARIEVELERLRTRLAEAQAKGERAVIAETSRDLRYWAARATSAEIVPPQIDTSEVRFGQKVRIRRDNGKEQTFRIVGIDEADPTKGSISYISPLAEAMIGATVGDEIEAGPSEATIIAIEPG